MNEAEVLVTAFKLWCWIGIAVAVPFLIFGIDRIDEDARGAYVFRLLLVPGIALIWPLVLWRWFALSTNKDTPINRYRPQRQNHKWFASLMPVAIVLIIVAGLSARQIWPADIAPQQLSTAPEITQ